MGERLLFPGLMAAFVAAVVLASGAGPVGFFVAATAIIVVLLGVERVRPLVGQGTTLDDPQAAGDLGHTVLASMSAQASDAVMLAAGAAAAGYVGRVWGLALWPVSWPYVVQGVLVVVLVDGVEYWRHRLLHRVSWLWPLHALHHSVDRFHVLKSGRNTFADMATRSIVVYAPLAALGVPTELLLWYPLALLVLGPLDHSDVDLPVPRFLQYLIVTPLEHRLHHARDVRLCDGNFAPVTPLWDIVFGTFHDPQATPPPPVGIEHDPLPQSFVEQALSPFLWRRFAH